MIQQLPEHLAPKNLPRVLNPREVAPRRVCYLLLNRS
jgi:hypothetical protein